MSFYSSIYIGKFFVFIPSASIYNPISLKFRDKTNKLKSIISKPKIKNIKTSKSWYSKVYLYPEILQRKWIEYSYKDRYIPPVLYDNVSPINVEVPFYTNIGKKFKINLKSTDYSYKKLEILIKNSKNEIVFSAGLKNVTPNKVFIIETTIKKPDIYNLFYIYNEKEYFMKSFIVFSRSLPIKDKRIISDFITSNSMDKISLFCSKCFSNFGFYMPILKDKYLYKDYIPFNDLLDIENYDSEYINEYIMNLPNPKNYNHGLVHLLNMIRLSTPENEIRIMGNLFRDDPAFAYFITNRLFLFDMIPLIADSELQNILGSIDDFTLAYALFDREKEVYDKIFNNISKRRAESVEYLINTLQTSNINAKTSPSNSTRPKTFQTKKSFKTKTNQKPMEDLINDAKNEVNKTIKNYFLEKYGRVIKIPISKRIVYRKIAFNSLDELVELIQKTIIDKNSNQFETLHYGNLIIYNGIDMAILNKTNKFHECLPYDSEYYGDKIFKVTSVDESSIYMESLKNIKLALIHIYDWKNTLENIEKLEFLKGSDVVPIFYISDISIITIGALDFKDRPYEQIIRIAVKS